MSKVSDKSTKAQILEEVARLESELKAARESKVTVADQEVAKVKETKITSAKAVIDMGILNPEIVKQFNDVNFAIEEAKKQLATIQEVKEAIIDAEAVIMAKDALLAKRDKELQEKIDIAKIEAEDIIAKKEAKVAELEAQYADLKVSLEKERKRESEEYAYNLKRDRKIEDDKWADVKANREKALSERETVVSLREEKVSETEADYLDLQLKVEGIPLLISEAKEVGKTEAEKQLAKEKAIEVNAVKKNAEWEIKVATMEKERAVEDLAKANDRIASLEAKLEAAYASMNTLATTTVQSTGGVKILETGKDK